MTNSEIAKAFNELAGLMELHEENRFKVNSYSNAYRYLRKLGDPLSEMSEEEIADIRGVGKAIAGKIMELVEMGTMDTLEKWRAVTPVGIRQMLTIKGFGPKKIRTIWNELELTTVDELLDAIDDNRLVSIKGFGAKTQQQLKEQLEYFQYSKDKFHYAKLEGIALEMLADLHLFYPDEMHAFTGDLARRKPILEAIDFLTTADEVDALESKYQLVSLEDGLDHHSYEHPSGFKVSFHFALEKNFGTKLIEIGTSAEFKLALTGGKEIPSLAKEQEVFAYFGKNFAAPELREMESPLQGFRSVGEQALDGWSPELVEVSDIRGVVHAHSTYSDGLNSIKDMAERAASLGYEYLGLTDHSKTAFYADGLKEEELEIQWKEIDKLNAKNPDFRIFKGIESDILANGSLDYVDEILAQFDFIIASVHSNLKMDEAKATKRIISAVENPYTTILGHPTGRLLLSRKGYPLDFKKVIDACSANGVAIEINANPLRLDLDWHWVPYALSKDIKIAINPDAHSLGGIEDIKWGAYTARKGGLTKSESLCSLSMTEFEGYCQQKRN